MKTVYWIRTVEGKYFHNVHFITKDKQFAIYYQCESLISLSLSFFNETFLGTLIMLEN